MSAAPPLVVEGVSAGYGRTEILSDVSFQVGAGEIFGLIGLNGAGKTTLIKTILDLNEPRRGNIRVFGIDHRDHRSRRRLAYLPEQFSPAPVLKGAEWLALSQGYYGLAWQPREAEALSAGLALDRAALRRRVTTYSKGMAQKLGLVSMFLSRRPLLILDEPMSGLDPLARLRLKERLLSYRAAGDSVFFSSHVLADVEALCDRVAVMHEGRVVFVGSPMRLRAEQGGAELEYAFLGLLDAHGEAGAGDRLPRSGAGAA